MRPRKLLLSLLIATATLPALATPPAPQAAASLSTPAPSTIPVDEATVAKATAERGKK